MKPLVASLSLFAFLCVGITAGCSVRQQQEVLGTIGMIIPGSKRPASSSEAPPATTTVTTASPQPDPNLEDAQLVLRTLQRAMADNPASFQTCLDEARCKLAFTAYLVRLQRQAMSTIELPSVYDRYDLKRGTE